MSGGRPRGAEPAQPAGLAGLAGLAEPAAGPSVVALGGGHGLAASLRALRAYAGEITAIVSVADDGGSSGRLREAFDILPPGDIRKCILALGEPDSVWVKALEHRFEAGELQGHAVGNLLIAGLVAVTGDFVGALDQVGRLVGAGGRVLPATVEPVVLKAVTAEGEVSGQLAVGQCSGIATVSLVPDDPEAPKAALEAIARADQVVIGPGSLYTSVLAALAVPAIASAVREASAQVVYVCNLRPERPETAAFDVADHLGALLAHGVDPDVVLCDTSGLPLGQPDRPWVDLPLARPSGLAHDPARLAAALAGLLGWGQRISEDQHSPAPRATAPAPPTREIGT